MAVDTIVAPISDEEPCGQDLDLEEDGAYLQFTSVTEALLPDTFMVEDEEGKRVPFYSAQRFQGLDLGARLKAGEKLLERTHDLRLLATVAKLHLLNRSLTRFEETVAGMALLLQTFWEQVHPQSPDERSNALERLTEPLLLAALNYATLFKSRRFGMVTWISYLAATKPKDGGAEGTEGVDRILREEVNADPTPFAEAQAQVLRLRASLEGIVTVCAERSSAGAPKLDRIIAPVTAITELMERIHPIAVETPADVAPSNDVGEPDADDSFAVAPPRTGNLPLLPSATAAEAALAEAVRFFATVEPSSPCLILLRQAQALVGKSFLEALQILVPDSVDKAFFPFISAPASTLPLRQLTENVGNGATDHDEDTSDDQSVDGSFNTVTSRADALALLEQISAFYRFVEPSSPIPILVDRARALSGKDFGALLKALLPAPPPSE